MKQRVVIKLGGSSLQNESTMYELATAVRGFRDRGYDVVIVHGGGPAINAELVRRGIEWKFINGQRQTTSLMMEVIEEVLGCDVNKRIVSGLRESDIPAVGLSGARDRILFCTQADPELMQVGQVACVEASAIEAVLKSPMRPVPVIAPIGFDGGDVIFNVNADWAATKIAVALNATKLVFLTDQSGILDHKKDLVKTATPVKIQKMIDTGVISGGMLTKVYAMMSALTHGVDQIRVMNASYASHLFSRSRFGTLLRDDERRASVKEVAHVYAS